MRASRPARGGRSERHLTALLAASIPFAVNAYVVVLEFVVHTRARQISFPPLSTCKSRKIDEATMYRFECEFVALRASRRPTGLDLDHPRRWHDGFGIPRNSESASRRHRTVTFCPLLPPFRSVQSESTTPLSALFQGNTPDERMAFQMRRAHRGRRPYGIHQAPTSRCSRHLLDGHDRRIEPIT